MNDDVMRADDNERGGDGDHERDGHLKIEVTVRTPAGIPRLFDVRQNELDADVITTSVRYFSRRGERPVSDGHDSIHRTHPAVH